MSGYSEEDFQMTERRTYSLNVSPSTNSNFEHRRSRSLHHVDPTERPNMVISGHRNFTKTLYTGPRINFNRHAKRIVEKLQENETLMEDTPASEQLRREALRDLPQCLTIKRCVKRQLSLSVSQKSKRKPIGFWKRTKYRMSIAYSKFVYDLKNFNYFDLWHGTLKNIEGRFGSGYASYFKFLRWLFVMNLMIGLLSFSMIVVPQIIFDTSGRNVTANNYTDFNFKDIFTGNGFLKTSVFYYGHYTNYAIEVIPYLVYNMPVAYFAVVVCLYMISLIVLAVSVAESYRRTFIETEGGLPNVYAHRIFCAWDYSIATEETADLKSSAIYNELRELLNEDLDNSEQRSCLYKFWTFSLQIFVNILIFVLIAVVGWVTWLVLKFCFTRNDDAIVVTAVVANFIIMFFPSIFRHIADYEGYKSPRTALYITLTRTYILGAVIIGVILSFWLIHVQETDCWENNLGSEFYRLIVFDFLFSVILTTIIDIFYSVARYFAGYEPKSEFNVSRHTLQIIYNQGLFWIGLIYSPISPILVTLKMLIIWYVREGCVQKLCKPPKKTWRAAQAQTWFKMMLFVSILLVIAAHGYTLTSVRTSSCGPFSNYTYAYEILTNGVSYLEEDSIFWRLTLTITKPGGIALIMIAVGILTYYVREQAVASKKEVKLLREMLVLSTADKKYLIRWYNSLTKGHLDSNFRHLKFDDPCKSPPNQYIEKSNSTEDDLSDRFKMYS